MQAAEMQTEVFKCYYVERKRKNKREGGEMNEESCVKHNLRPGCSLYRELYRLQKMSPRIQVKLLRCRQNVHHVKELLLVEMFLLR